MQLYTQDFPLVAAPLDDTWILFRDLEDLAFIYIKSITQSAVVEIASGLNGDPAGLGAPTTLTFTQAGVTLKQSLPITGTRLNRGTRIRPLSGQVSVSVISPTPFNGYIAAPVVSTFGPL